MILFDSKLKVNTNISKILVNGQNIYDIFNPLQNILNFCVGKSQLAHSVEL